MPSEPSETKVRITSDRDILAARNKGRAMAEGLGFSRGDLVLISTAISELARNIVLYAGQGELTLTGLNSGKECRMTIVARDEGPGIPDLDLAMRGGYSTSGGLGLGLPGVRRLMDEFHIESRVGRGTTVTVKKWKKEASRS